MAQGNATVKSVLSGDTLVLMGAATNGPPPELTLTLSSLQAPRLARGSDQNSEPWAWESREFLRKLVIGKNVSFKVEYKVPSINRDFGSVKFQGENLCITVARAGWAKVKSADQSRSGQCQDLDAMLSAQESAMSEKKGIYSDTTSTSVLNYVVEDPDSILNEYKGKLVSSVIETVRDGSSMRVVLLPSMRVVNFYLSGVQCPRMNAPKSAGEAAAKEGPAPHARETKHFVEVRLLNRQVDLRLEGLDKFGNFYGTIMHPNGNISVELLKRGMGKMTDWSASFAPMKDRTVMRDAEKYAKKNQLRVWKGYEAPVLQGAGQFTGKVIEVVSGDTFVVWVNGLGEKRVSLSSIRSPRMGNERRGEAHAPFAWEAKEYLRSILIGKEVQISVDYERALNQSAPTNQGESDNKESQSLTRSFATAIIMSKKKGQNSNNVAEMVVREGWAEVIRHRQDEERASQYDLILSAESRARTEKKGRFSGKDPGQRRLTDLSVDSNKAKQYLPFLRRSRVLQGVVEVVISGTRLKIYIPKENCIINFVMSGIKCPQASRVAVDSIGHKGKPISAREAEPFGNEAKSFTRSNLMQRNVEIEIEDMDRMGSAFGPLYVTNSKSNDNRESFACELLREGYATTDSYSIERTRVSAELLRAEKAAKESKRRIWLNQTPKVEHVEKSADEEFAKVQLSEIADGSHFYIHVLDDNSLPKIEKLMKDFTLKNGIQGSAVELKRNSVVAALFDDGSGPSWFRAKVEVPKVAADGSAKIRYIDYGNASVLSPNKFRPLDQAIAALPAQAKECVLGFVKVPSLSDDYGQDAAMLLNDLAWGKMLRARVHGKDEIGRMQVSLYDESTSITESLVDAGLARVNRKARVMKYQSEVVQGIENAQERARKSRACIWRYGDVESDDEEP